MVSQSISRALGSGMIASENGKDIGKARRKMMKNLAYIEKKRGRPGWARGSVKYEWKFETLLCLIRFKIEKIWLCPIDTKVKRWLGLSFAQIISIREKKAMAFP